MSHPLFDHPLADTDPLSSESLRAFKRSMMLHRRLMVALLSGEPLHPAQAGCLQALIHHDGMSQSDLASVLHVSRPTVTGILQRMEAAGIVKRMADDSDSRVTRVYVTESGHEVGTRMHQVIGEVLRLSVGALTPGEREELTRLLKKMNDSVEAELAARGVSPQCHHGHAAGEGL